MVGARQEGEDRLVSKLAIRRALVSVYDKTGLEDLARGLHETGVEIVSTGSTAARVTATGVPVTPVEQLTGFRECLDGRVKTLHPHVHAGLLADTSRAEHRAQLAELRVQPFGLLVCNLYPFESAVSSGATPDECVEQIDIGGPAMVRAAAKNHTSVAVVTDPAAYPRLLTAVRGGGFTLEERRRLAASAFAHTAAYDSAVATWFASVYAPDETALQTGWPQVTGGQWRRREVLRYGENPHQAGALYVSASGSGVACAAQLQGKQMSYNNYVDADAGWRAAWDFTEPCVAIIKHTNPCGIAVGGDALLQSADVMDTPGDDPASWELRSGTAVAAEMMAYLTFAWRACRAVKSNAILLASGGATVGVGMGQVNRVDSARLAVSRAGERAQGAVAASDAFFPFPDGLQVLADAGVRAVVEPGGSVRDEEVVTCAQSAGITLYFTGTRHFFH